MVQNNNTIMETKNNKTKMGTLILKHGDFILKYFKHCDIYFLFYKDHAIWDGEFHELFETRLIEYVFERESDPKKAAEFITELYNWGFSQQEAYKKMLGEIYGEKI